MLYGLCSKLADDRPGSSASEAEQVPPDGREVDYGERKRGLQHFDRNSAQSARKSMQRMLRDGVHVSSARAQVLESLRYQAECKLQAQCRRGAERGGPWAAAGCSTVDTLPVLLLNFSADQVCRHDLDFVHVAPVRNSVRQPEH